MTKDVKDPEAVPVAGEAMTLEAVTPSAAEQKADGRARVGNTAVQAGVPGATIVIGSWLAALLHVDLDPSAGVDLPAPVAGAFGVVLTVAMAYVMNRKKLNAVD